MNRALRLLPVILVIWILGTFAWRLIQPNDSIIRSQLVNREIPAFQLPGAIPETAGLKSADLATGKPRLLNLFASWCVPCVGEAPVLAELHRRGVEIDGIAVRDTPGAVGAFLRRYGNPYGRIGSDPTSRVQLSLGSAGVPETFVIDGKGVMRLQHVGPIDENDIPEILAALEKAK